MRYLPIPTQFIALLFLFVTHVHGTSTNSKSHEGALNRSHVFYEIFVRSFQDSNGDGIGDLNGITSRLGYLETLGIDAIWLTPIFQSPSYHGYDTTDYYAIKPDYGTKEDLGRLLQEAHKRKIKVILDLVLNHTSSEHPWFIDSATSKTSDKREWYIWSSTDPGWTQPWGDGATWHSKNDGWYYGVFWSGMPDLNYKNSDVKTTMFAIAKHWLNFGVDGFRLDAARYMIETGKGAGQADVPETHAFLKEFSDFVKNVKPEAMIVAENWSVAENIARYFEDVEMNFNFPLSEAILASVGKGNADTLKSVLKKMTQLYPSGFIDAPFLTNHDQVRVASMFDGNHETLKNAAAILLTLPGNPFIYYGEEIGMINGDTQNDEAKRTPMVWDKTEYAGFSSSKPWFPFSTRSRNERLLKRYKSLIAARKSSTTFRNSPIKLADLDNSKAIGWTLNSADEQVFVVHNVSDTPITVSTTHLNASAVNPLWRDDQVTLDKKANKWELSLPPRSSGIWTLKP